MRKHARSWALTAALTVLTALFVTASVGAAWVDRVLLDEDRFSGRVSSTLETDVVSRYLALRLTDQLILRAPDLITVRPALELVMQDAVRSRTAIAGARTAVREAHRAIRAGVPAESIVLDLRAARSLADLLLRESAPAVAARLPRDVDSARLDGALVGLRTDVFERAEQLALLLPLLASGAVVLLGATVLLAPSRRGGVFAAGIAIVAGGAIGLIGQRGVDLLLASLLPRPEEAAPAVTVLWRTVMQDYVAWNTALVAIGLITLSASVASARLPERESVREVVLRAQWARALGGAIAIVVGLALVRWPLSTLTVLLLVAGAILSAIGAVLLFRSILYGVEQAKQAAATTEYRGPRLRPPVFAGAAVAAAVFIIGLWFWSALRSTPPEPWIPPVTTCNGSEALCERPLDEVVFAGTHNSMAASFERGWYFPAQRGGIADQLRAGVRVFLIDTYYGQETARGVRTIREDEVSREQLIAQHGEDVVVAAERVASRLLPGGTPGIFLCHSFCELGATSLRGSLATMRDYLDAQPGTFLVIFVQDQTAPEDTIPEFQRAGLAERAYHHPVGDPWPTLGELLQRGKQLLVLVEHDAGDQEDWYQYAWSLVQDTRFDVPEPEQMDCSRFRGTEDAPLLLMNHWLSVRPSTPATALPANEYESIMRRVELCQLERGMTPNFIAVDFYDTGDLFEVVNELNAAEP